MAVIKCDHLFQQKCSSQIHSSSQVTSGHTADAGGDKVPERISGVPLEPHTQRAVNAPQRCPSSPSGFQMTNIPELRQLRRRGAVRCFPVRNKTHSEISEDKNTSGQFIRRVIKRTFTRNSLDQYKCCGPIRSRKTQWACLNRLRCLHAPHTSGGSSQVRSCSSPTKRSDGGTTSRCNHSTV